MKKSLCILLTLFLAAGLFAGSIDYLSNQSINWMMTTSRNAATDSADIVNFNPAGTVFLPQGLSLDVSNQTLFKFYKNELDSPVDKTLEQDEPTWFLPNLYAVYNFGRMGPGLLAAYLQAGIVAGGGNLNYEDGTAGTMAALGNLVAGIGAATSSFEASSIYYGIGLGGAYSFLEDKLSVSLGGRLVIPRRSLTLKADYAGGPLSSAAPGSITAEYEYNALGFTPILGFDVRPVEGLTLALRYEMQTQLEFEYSEKELTATHATVVTSGVVPILTSAGIADGETFKQNLPHIIGIGVEYKINDAFTASLSGTFYLLSASKMGSYDDYTQALGYDAAFGITYQVIEPLKIGAGVSFTESGIKDSYFSEEILNASANPPLDSVAFGLGCVYSFNQNFDIGLAFLYSHYEPHDYSVSGGAISGTYKKDVLNAGIGVGFHY